MKLSPSWIEYLWLHLRRDENKVDKVSVKCVSIDDHFIDKKGMCLPWDGKFYVNCKLEIIEHV